MIFRHSRYTNTQMYDRNGVSTFKIRPYASFSLEDCDSYIWEESSTLDSLAFDYYGDSQLWWVIADTNIATVDPFNIPCGTEILIPSRKWVLELYG